jgi:TetR/AcrR family transcriptional repressor of nem operon
MWIMSRKPTDTRERILDTATNLFSSHGFRATSIDDILTAVGITKGAFYHYFNGKEHLCEVIFDQAAREYHQLADSIRTGDQGTELLPQWLEMLTEKQRSGQWLYCRLISRLSIESSELNGEMQNKLRMFWLWCQTFYETLIRKAMAEKGDAPPADPAQTARLFIAAHFGAMWLDRCAPATEDLTTVCETLLKLTLTPNA